MDFYKALFLSHMDHVPLQDNLVRDNSMPY